MSYAKQMLDTYPRDFNLDAGRLAAAIDALYDCAQACTACADACLSEEQVAELVKCIQLNLSCADVCLATGRTLSRQTEYDANLTRALLEACVQSCRSCAEECERHAEMGMEHCRVCAEACRRCEQACQDLLDAIAG
jgi:hypothetical protein